MFEIRKNVGTDVYPDNYPQLSMFDSCRICRDGMGPMNQTNRIRMQSRPARQPPCNDFWVIVSVYPCPCTTGTYLVFGTILATTLSKCEIRMSLSSKTCYNNPIKKSI